MQNRIIKTYSDNKFIIPFTIFFIGLFLFTTAQFNHEFVQFESRFGLFAQEMWRNGISFFPTTYNKLYPDYPATQTILTYLLSLVVGKITLMTAILPTAIASAATLTFTYNIGSLRSRLWGIYAVLFLLFTYNFLGSARSITLDQFTTTATVACFYLVYSSQILNQTKRLWFLPLFWIFGFAIRGPIGLIIPASVSAGCYLLNRQWRNFFIISLSSLLLLFICCIGLLIAANYQGGISFVHDVIHMEVVGRVINTEMHSRFSYFFLGFQDYWMSFPIALLVFFATFKNIFSHTITEDVKLLRQLFFWIFIVMIGLSVTSTAKDRYILPMTPAAALAASYVFISFDSNSFLLAMRKVLLLLSTALPFIGLISVIACNIFGRVNHLELDVHYIFLICLMILLCLLIIYLYRNNIKQSLQQLGIGICATATFVALYIGVIQPLDIQFNSAKIFVSQFEQIYKPNQDIVFYRIGPDQEDIKFMVAIDKPILPIFIHSEQQLLQYNKPALFIAKDTDFNNLSAQVKNQIKIIYIQKLGHRKCVVFEKI